MASSMESQKQLQVKFITKLEEYAVPEAPFSVPATIDVDGLSDLINELLKESKETESGSSITFDFLINGEFLRVPLSTFLEEHNVSAEAVLELEYVTRHPSPEPHVSLQHDDWVAAVHVSGEWIVCGCYDSSVQVWNTRGTHLTTITGHGGPVKGVRWLGREEGSDRRLILSVSQDQNLMCWAWDPKSFQSECLYVGRGHERAVDALGVDPTQQMVATGGWDNVLKVWATDPATENNEELDLGSSEAKRGKVAPSAGKTKSKVPLVTLAGHSEAISAVMWPQVDQLATASWDHTIRFWDHELGSQTSSVVGNKSFFDADWRPQSNLIITASADRHVRLYDPRSKEGALVKSTFTGHTAWVSCVRWSTLHEHLFISGGYDKVLRLWDIRSPRATLYDMEGHMDKILCCDWSNPEFLVSGGADDSVKMFTVGEKARGA